MTILAIILGVIVVLQPIFIFQAVKFGIKCAEKPEIAASEPIFNVKDPETRDLTDEERKWQMIRQNVDNYVGDSTNQQEII